MACHALPLKKAQKQEVPLHILNPIPVIKWMGMGLRMGSGTSPCF